MQEACVGCYDACSVIPHSHTHVRFHSIMFSLSRTQLGALSVIAGLLASSASAQLITTSLTATNQGWYNSDGESNSPADTNYGVGQMGGPTFRNFFVFDRAMNPLLGNVEFRGATLKLYNPSELTDEGNGYASTDVNDTGALFSVYKYSGSIGTLNAGTGGLAAYNDLGTDAGGAFGSGFATSASNGTVLNFTLGSTFLSYLNGVSGQFALGGSLSDPNDSPASGDFEVLFGFTSDAPRAILELQFVAVPEPSTYGLIGAGLLGGLVVWRRRSARAGRSA